MPRKQFVTKTIEGEGGGEVTYWVNPPSGHVRRLRRATAALNVVGLQQGAPTNLEELQDVLDAAEKSFAADDDVWACVLQFVDRWTLTGWSETGEPLPVSMMGLDMLDEPMRAALLTALSEALEEASALTPTTGSRSSSTNQDANVPSDASAGAVVVALPTSSTTGSPNDQSGQDSLIA